MATARETKGRASRTIARRTMWLGPGNTRVTVGIRMPEPDPASGQGDWRCGFAISGLGRPVRKHAYGVDAVQALQLAMVRIRLALEPYRDRLTWSGCTLETARSEEHTSELQSRENLVCRLLLEKKKPHHKR